MTARIVRTDAALRDLDEQAKYIQRDSADAAVRFLKAAQASFELLARSPDLGQRQEFRDAELAGVRVWRVQGFANYLIFYRAIPKGIEVLRVLHAARDIEAAFRDKA